MASKTFSGQLDQAMNEAAAEGNKILFIPQQTVGEVLPGAASELVVESDGTYSIKLAYNTYSIYHYSDVTKRKTLLATDIVVSTDTAVTTIPDLLGSVVPVTEDSVLTIQGYLDEANQAKTDAETAQAETEALFDDFDSSVADSMALVHTETPSLSIPFNESGRLDYGVGTEYVSGLPVYGVDFARSTTSTVVNKSGVIETLSSDEIGIGPDGAWLHDAYTNNVLYSNDFTQSNWSKLNCTVTDDGTYASTGLKAYLLEFTSGVTGYVRQSVSNGGAGFCWVKGTSGETIRIDVRTSDASVVDQVTVTLSGSWQRISTISVYDSDSFDGSTTIYAGIRRDTANTATSLYVSQFDLTDTTVNLPPIVTTSSTTSVTATTCTVPVSGNLPAAGESFTIFCNAAVPNSKSVVFGVTNESFVLWRFDEDGNVSLRISDGTTSKNVAVSLSTDGNTQRYAITYDSDTETVSTYADGVFINSEDFSDIDWSLTPLGTGTSLSLGGPIQSSHLNSQIKNFKVLPYAASADEVKSWGAPK